MKNSNQILVTNEDFIAINSYEIKLDSVIEDSRCPIGQKCIWAGNAKVRFLLIKNSKERFLILNSNPSMGADIYFEDIYITLENLDPYPETNSNGLKTLILQKEYKALLSVKSIK